MRFCALSLLACCALASHMAHASAQSRDTGDVSALYPGKVTAVAPDNDDGRHIHIHWSPPGYTGDSTLVFRAPASASATTEVLAGMRGHRPEVGQTLGAWRLIAMFEDRTRKWIDEVAPDGRYVYAVVTARPLPHESALIGTLSDVSLSAEVSPQPDYFNETRWFFLTAVVAMALAFFGYVRIVRRNPDKVFVRRIPGVDVIEESIGRATEMGRPVLYVTGTDELQNIQTIASLLILSHVSKIVAEYDTDIKVANYYPLTMVVAEEIVKQGFADAGRIDAHKPENVMFIAAEQFAFAAGVNGMILRDRPATNIYLGAFFAESLILAETGYVAKSVQIAGTARITQLPFFIAACDYTIIGEELYAVSAYLAREPTLLAMLKATDLLKLMILIILVIGALGATTGLFQLGPALVP